MHLLDEWLYGNIKGPICRALALRRNWVIMGFKEEIIEERIKRGGAYIMGKIQKAI